MSNNRNSWSKAVVILLSTFIVLSGGDVVFSDEPNPSPNLTQSTLPQEANLPFTWAGKSSAVLHPGSAQSAGLREVPLKRIDSDIETAIDQGVMPGAVVLVARRGTIAKHQAYGDAYRYKDDEFTKVDEIAPMSQDTIFDIASISKLFTTTAAMKLYEAGEFELDDPVAEYIPEFAQNGKDDVTIRQLMTHTSGFEPWIPLYTMGENRDDRLQIVFEQPLTNDPGSNYTYSDLNLITLGALVERVSGQRLDQFVKEKITEPLDMNDTMYNPSEELKSRIAATEYQPYLDRGMVQGEVHDENAWSLDGVAGHAGVFSTAKDLATFAHMILQDGTYKGKQILEPETVKLMRENQLPEFEDDDHGLGWELNQGWYMDALSESSTMGHTGFTGTSIVVSPSNDTIAILLTNRVHPTRSTVSTNPIRRQFARQVADAIPVKVSKNESAWFSGYGNELNATLTAKFDRQSVDAKLSFDTWYKIEQGADFGRIEISKDGDTWSSIGDSITGDSQDWEDRSETIPAGTKYIRFIYETDSSVNGRGWYINHPTLISDNGKKQTITFMSDQWEQRNY